MQNVFKRLNEAKVRFGTIREYVNAAIRQRNGDSKESLLEEITETIASLSTLVPFFQSIGKKYEIDHFIIAYSSLSARLNSS